MSTLTEIINNFTNFFNGNNIKFVIGGGVAIKYLCNKYLTDKDVQINNLDIFYIANTPIAASIIGGCPRIQNAPCRSATYTTNDNFKINLTMNRVNNMRYVEFNDMKLMHPEDLISYYIDHFSFENIDINKINLLTDIIDIVSELPTLYINKHNYLQTNKRRRTLSSGEPLARRLFVES